MTDTMEVKKTPLKESSSQEQSIFHTISPSHRNFPFVVIAIGIVLLGLATGYILQSQGKGAISTSKDSSTSGDDAKKGKIYGSGDEKTFPDTSEGTLEKGGLDGEGSHKLIRPGGESQTAYLTSSVLDLDEFVGKKVKVWGQTNQAQKAGWFMDVGKIEVLE